MSILGLFPREFTWNISHSFVLDDQSSSYTSFTASPKFKCATCIAETQVTKYFKWNQEDCAIFVHAASKKWITRLLVLMDECFYGIWKWGVWTDFLLFVCFLFLCLPRTIQKLVTQRRITKTLFITECKYSLYSYIIL